MLFFYGTLIAGSANAVADTVHHRLSALGPASVAGALWAIPDPAGWYPALVPGPGRVHGVLYGMAADFGPADLALLDAWEDFRPDQPAASLYVRTIMPAIAGDGAIRPAQAYRYNQPLPDGARPVAGGDFSAWLGVNRFAGYTR